MHMKRADTELFSVIVVCYNQERFVEETLNSILSLDDRVVELPRKDP